MKKRILFMLTSMNIGGVEKSFLSLLSTMQKEKYDITLLLLEKKGGFLDYLPKWIHLEETTWYKSIKPIIMQPPQKTIKQYYLANKKTKIPGFLCAYIKSRYFNNRYSYYKHVLKNVPIEKRHFDIAISYQGPTDIIDFYVANKVKADKKISWVHFDVSQHSINIKLYEKLYAKFNKIHIVSDSAKHKLETSLPSLVNKTSTYPNIVQIDLINKMSQQNIEFDEDFDGLKIVTVGRLSKEKGQDLAVEVLAKLKKAGYNVRWYCVGEGQFRSELEALIDQFELNEDFILLGSTPNPYPYISLSDIYVQTSRHDGYCLTLAEAILLQKPIVTTNFIGAYEQIENRITGYIVNCNVEELFQKIIYLLESKAERNRLIEQLQQSKVSCSYYTALNDKII